LHSFITVILVLLHAVTRPIGCRHVGLAILIKALDISLRHCCVKQGFGGRGAKEPQLRELLHLVCGSEFRV
jgi:hypothetical protein